MEAYYFYAFAGDYSPMTFCFLAVREYVMIYFIKVCEHDISKTACENFTKFTT